MVHWHVGADNEQTKQAAYSKILGDIRAEQGPSAQRERASSSKSRAIVYDVAPDDHITACTFTSCPAKLRCQALPSSVEPLHLTRSVCLGALHGRATRGD